MDDVWLQALSILSATLRMATIMSRVMVGISNASSAPPWYSAPNRIADSTMPIG